MRNIFYCTICALILGSCADESRTSLKLHYDKPAEYFEEALPLGNGRLGAMVYGGTSCDRISLNDITLWTGEPDKGGEHPDYELIESLTPWGEASQWMEQVRQALDEEDYVKADQLQRRLQGHFSENYQPLGWLEIAYPEGEITDYYRELDISKALATVQYKKDGKAFKAEYLVSSPDSVIVIRLTGEAPIEAEIKLNSRLPHESKAEGTSIISEGYTAYHSYPVYYHAAQEKFMYDPDRGVHYRTVVRCEDAVADGETLKVSGVNETIIYITNNFIFF